MPDIEHNAVTHFVESAARRRMLKFTGLGAAALVAAGTTAKAASTLAAPPATPTPAGDAAVFNFALNFEYLGAEFYLRAIGRAGLPSELTGNGGPVQAPSTTAVPFENTAIAYLARRLAEDEYGHARFIREVLGDAAIPEPAIDLETSWTTLAVAAGLIQPGEIFNPFADETSFLRGAYVLEDVCVTALAGAAATLTAPASIAAAAGLLGAEGYHAGAIRERLGEIGEGTATDAISALRAKLSGVPDFGTQTRRNLNNFANVDSNGTPQQVLAIAYGGPGSSGGFFPNGVNGSITTT